MKRSVSHDVELFSRSQPGAHCRLLPLTEETVRVSAAEDLHGGVGQGLEPPEHSIGELSVEISSGGQVPRVTEINEAVVTVELTEDVQGLGVLAGDVVVDPQSPPREQSAGGLCQRLEQSQEPRHGVAGLTVLWRVVAVAEDPLSRPQGRGEVVTGGRSHVGPGGNYKGRVLEPSLPLSGVFLESLLQ